MQTLEDDEDRSRSPGLLPHKSANITVMWSSLHYRVLTIKSKAGRLSSGSKVFMTTLSSIALTFGRAILLCIQAGKVILGRDQGRLEELPEPVPRTCLGLSILSYRKDAHGVHGGVPKRPVQ